MSHHLQPSIVVPCLQSSAWPFLLSRCSPQQPGRSFYNISRIMAHFDSAPCRSPPMSEVITVACKVPAKACHILLAVTSSPTTLLLLSEHTRHAPTLGLCSSLCSEDSCPRSLLGLFPHFLQGVASPPFSLGSDPDHPLGYFNPLAPLDSGAFLLDSTFLFT